MAREILVDDSDPREIIAKMLRSAPRSSRDELQQEWNGPGDENASEYLRERGYVLAKDYWIAPVNPAVFARSAGESPKLSPFWKSANSCW
jgi:hypothetical protein